MIKTLIKFLLAFFLVMFGIGVGAGIVDGIGAIGGAIVAGYIARKLIFGHRKLSCTHFQKKVDLYNASSCDFFQPIPTEGSGVEFAQKILSRDYQPVCSDCRFEKGKYHLLYGRFQRN